LAALAEGIPSAAVFCAEDIALSSKTFAADCTGKKKKKQSFFFSFCPCNPQRKFFAEIPGRLDACNDSGNA